MREREGKKFGNDHARRFSSVTIVGSGVMGRAIAVACASKGLKVVFYDSQLKVLESAMRDSETIISRLARMGAIEDGARATAMMSKEENLQSAISPSQLIIESVPEDLELKSSIFGQLDSMCVREKILASNTSGLSITEIARSTRNPERVVGIHFFAPAYILKTVEVVPGAKTSAETLKAAEEFAISIGKVPVVLKKVTPDFVVNSIQFAMLREARRLLNDGVVNSMLEIDQAIRHSIPLRQVLFGLFEDSDLISPYSALTHPGREDLKTNYAYSEPEAEVIATRDELLIQLERLAETLRSRCPRVNQ